ncbi:DegQ family regulator [Bacillus kexueae]|nr:DegQ family regulator [Bacillus kexueae]
MKQQEIEKLNEIFMKLEEEIQKTKHSLYLINKSIEKYDQYQYVKPC